MLSSLCFTFLKIRLLMLVPLVKSVVEKFQGISPIFIKCTGRGDRYLREKALSCKNFYALRAIKKGLGENLPTLHLLTTTEDGF